MPASISPGATALARMPREPHSSAICWVSRATPALVAPYAPAFGPGCTPFMEVTVTMEAGRPAAMRRATARAEMNVPVRFTSITARQSSTVRSSRGPNRTIPALHTRPSGDPGRLGEAIERGLDGARRRCPPRRQGSSADRTRRSRRGLPVAVEHPDRPAGRDCGGRDGRAEPVGGSGHDDVGPPSRGLACRLGPGPGSGRLLAFTPGPRPTSAAVATRGQPSRPPERYVRATVARGPRADRARRRAGCGCGRPTR